MDATRYSAGLPILHLQNETLLDGAIDLLIETDKAFRIIVFKTDALDGISADQVIERNGYRQQMRQYADAVAALHETDAVQTMVVFTESGVVVDV